VNHEEVVGVQEEFKDFWNLYRIQRRFCVVEAKEAGRGRKVASRKDVEATRSWKRR
jgi:hypothetical protein